MILPAASGIAGRVHFERQAYWAGRHCIYWVAASKAVLPRTLRPGLWLLRRHQGALPRPFLGLLAAMSFSASMRSFMRPALRETRTVLKKEDDEGSQNIAHTLKTRLDIIS